MNPQRCALTLLLVLVITVSPVSLNASRATDERPFLELSRPERGKVFAIAWSPDGQYIAVGTEQGLWIYTDTFADVTHVEDKPIHALAWSPDGKTVAAGYFGIVPVNSITWPGANPIVGGGLKLWSVQSTTLGIELVLDKALIHDGSGYSLRFKPDGSKLAVLWQDSLTYGESTWGNERLQIYAMTSGNLVYDAATEHSRRLPQTERFTLGANGLEWTDDEHLTVILNFHQEKETRRHFSILDTDEDKFTWQDDYIDEDSLYAPLSAVGWNNDSTQVAVSAITDGEPISDGGIMLCDRDQLNGTVCYYLPLMEQDWLIRGNVPTLAWRPHSSLLTYSEGTIIHLWDATTKQAVGDLNAAYDLVTMLAWKPDGSALLSAGSDYVIRLWTRFDTYQSPDPIPFKTITLPLLRKQDNAVSADGQWKVEVDHSNSTSLSLNVISTIDGSKRTIYTLSNVTQRDYLRGSWSPTGSTLISWSGTVFEQGCGSVWEDSVQFWSAETGAMLFDLGEISSLQWRPDGNAIAVGRQTGFRSIILEAREVPSGKILQTSPPSYEWDARFMQDSFDSNLAVDQWSPDGRLVAISASVGCGSWGAASVRLWDTETNAIVAELPTYRTSGGGSGNHANVVAWSPDGKLIAVQGFSAYSLYQVALLGDHTLTEVVWQPTSFTNYVDAGASTFSPDNRYHFVQGKLIDMYTSWPVFQFHKYSFDGYRWEGDTLIGVNRSTEIWHGIEVYFHTSDFLPE